MSLAYYNPPGTTGGRNNSGQFRDILIQGSVGYYALEQLLHHRRHRRRRPQPVVRRGPADQHPDQDSKRGCRREQPGACHDLFIDGNYLYVASNLNTTMKVFDISTPSNPTFVRNIVTYGVTSSDHLHDMTVKNGRMYTSNLTNGVVQIWDVNNIGTTAPTLLGQFKTDTVSTGRTHSTWPNADGTILAVAQRRGQRERQAVRHLQPVAFPDERHAGHTRRRWRRSTRPRSASTATRRTTRSSSATRCTSRGTRRACRSSTFATRSTRCTSGRTTRSSAGQGDPSSFIGYDGCWGVYPFFGYNKILLRF